MYSLKFQLNWIELKQIKCNRIQFNYAQIDWIHFKPIWIQFDFQFKPNWIQLNYEILIMKRCMLITFFFFFFGPHYPCKWVGEKSEIVEYVQWMFFIIVIKWTTSKIVGWNVFRNRRQVNDIQNCRMQCFFIIVVKWTTSKNCHHVTTINGPYTWFTNEPNFDSAS
jgi:hypothetical protein